jgi:hypothetical protein
LVTSKDDYERAVAAINRPAASIFTSTFKGTRIEIFLTLKSMHRNPGFTRGVSMASAYEKKQIPGTSFGVFLVASPINNNHRIQWLFTFARQLIFCVEIYRFDFGIRVFGIFEMMKPSWGADFETLIGRTVDVPSTRILESSSVRWLSNIEINQRQHNRKCKTELVHFQSVSCFVEEAIRIDEPKPLEFISS